MMINCLQQTLNGSLITFTRSLAPTVALALLVGNASAQVCGPPPTYAWARQVTVDMKSVAENHGGIAVDAAGNSYAVGQVNTALPGQLHNGEFDGFLIRYDANGNLVWTRQFGTAFDDLPSGVAIDGQGNIYVAGTTAGVFSGQSGAGFTDAFLLKFNSSGTLQWTRQFGTAGSDEVSSIAVDASNNLYIAGSTNGTWGGQSNHGDWDGFLIKYNSSGTQQWRRQFGTNSVDEGVDVVVDSASMVYVTGYTLGTFSGATSQGLLDMYVIKYNSSGSQQWVRQTGTSTVDLASSIIADSSNNVYIAGSTLGTFSGQSQAGSLDAFIVKYTSAGVLQWSRQFGSAGAEFVGGIALDSTQHLVIAGSTDGLFPSQPGSGGQDAFIAKFSLATLSVQWLRQFGTASFDELSDVVVDAANHIRAVGNTRGTFPGQPSNPSTAALLVRWPACGKLADVTGDGVVNVNDLLAIINAWGTCPAPPLGCSADVAPPPWGDALINVNDLLLVINNWG